MELHLSFRRRLPLVLQTEAAECGLACLAMVAGYHGHEVDLLTLRRRYPVSLKGATLGQLIELAGRLDFSARALRLDLHELEDLRPPAVLHWDLGHFVVLKAVRRRKLVIHDPARGVVIVPLKEVSKHFTGVALELTPSAKFTKRRERERLPLRSLWGKQRGLPGLIVQIFAFSIALEIFAILTPFFMQIVVDRVLVVDDWNLLTVLGLGFGFLMIISAGVTAFRSWVILFLSTHLNYQMLSRLFRHLLHLPLDYFTKRHIGDIVSRFGSLHTIQNTLTTQFVAVMVDGIMVFGTLAIMFVYSAKLSAIAILMVLLYGLVRWVSYSPLYRATYEHIVRGAKQQTNFLETVRGMQGIRLFGAESLRHGEWQNLFTDTLNAGIRVSKLSIGFGLMTGLIFGIGHIAVIWLGAVAIMRGNFTIGMLFAFLVWVGQFTGKSQNLIETYIQFRMLSLHSERVADIALTEPEEAHESAVLDSRRFSGALEVKNLGYRYGEGEREVFAGVSFTVRAGECIAIAGPSGVGKSTLVKLMLGLMKPDGGSILVDGLPVERFGLAEYRKHIAAVLQDDRLFAGSIADNISFFDLRPNNARIEACAKLAAIHEDVLAMPMGYHSLIGDMGTVLSGGQQQRVLLARALYKKPRILFLDEATSYLDLKREAAINEAVCRLKMTRIIVAHRPETLRYADRVLTLSAGGISEYARSQGDRIVALPVRDDSEIPAL
jgi:ATP-binding cassette subfamily B protein RaxB